MTNKVYITWQDAVERAKIAATRICKFFPGCELLLFPVPNGGIPAALLVQTELVKQGRQCRITDSLQPDCIVIDDVIDSGRTRRKFDYPFFALVDKPLENLLGKWIVMPWEAMAEDPITISGPEDAVVRLLQFIGEDPTRDGLRDTPRRVIHSYNQLFAGYQQDPADLMTVFDDPCDELVLVKDVEFMSTCEHHLLPFLGKAHIAYIPSGKVLGVSKLVRILEVFSRRLQIQERICQQVTQALDTHLQPQGSACVLEAKHLCMVCRGVQKQNGTMITSSLTGVFRSDAAARAELFSMIRS